MRLAVVTQRLGPAGWTVLDRQAPELGYAIVGRMAQRAEARFVKEASGYFQPTNPKSLDFKMLANEVPLMMPEGTTVQALHATVREGYFGRRQGLNDLLLRQEVALGLAASFLETTQPDVLLFLNKPERAIDYLTWKLAERKRISCIILRGLATAGGAFWASKSAYAPLFQSSSTLHGDVLKPRVTAANSLLELQSAPIGRRFSKSQLLPSPSWVTYLGVRGVLGVPRALARRAGISAATRTSTRPVRGSGGLAVFFLHLEPEAAIFPSETPFSSQLQAVARLRQILSDDWHIVVKEHPAIMKTSARADWRVRSRLFYDALGNMSGVSFNASRSRLDLAQVDLAATFGGSAGMEALSAGKPVVVFGPAYYQNLAGVIGPQELQDLTHARSIIEAAIALPAEQIQQDFASALRSASAATVPRRPGSLFVAKAEAGAIFLPKSAPLQSE